MAQTAGKGTFSASVTVFSYTGSTPDSIALGVKESGGTSYVRVEAAPGIFIWNYDVQQGW